MNNIQIVPLPDPRLVPYGLIDQIKEKKFNTHDWYSWQMELKDEPTNHLFALVDKKAGVVGIIHLTENEFEKHLFINTVSVIKEFQKGKKLMKFVKKHIIKVAKDLGLKHIIWCTEHPKVFERYGFRLSKTAIMEYEVKDG